MKGNIAKKFVFDAIKEVFGTAYAGEKDGKLYLNLDEDGVPVQVALSITCPKVPFVADDATPAPAQATSAAFPEPEKQAAPDVSKDEDEMISKFISSFGF